MQILDVDVLLFCFQECSKDATSWSKRNLFHGWYYGQALLSLIPFHFTILFFLSFFSWWSFGHNSIIHIHLFQCSTKRFFISQHYCNVWSAHVSDDMYHYYDFCFKYKKKKFLSILIHKKGWLFEANLLSPLKIVHLIRSLQVAIWISLHL